MQNWPSYQCLKLSPKTTRARKKHQGGAMVIRRMDVEAGADADAETQIKIDFEAEGSSREAAGKQRGRRLEAVKKQ